MEQEVIFKGLPISVSMKRYPKIFDDFYVNLIRAGEVTGKMGEAFATCANFLERDIGLRKRVSAAMTYPIVVLVVCIGLVFGLCIFVMPTFVTLFEGLNITLPIVTRILIAFVKGVRNPFVDLLALIFGIFMLNAYRVYYATVQGKKLVDTFAINLILIGDLLRKVLITRFSWTMAGLISAGISVMEALKTSEMVITNAYMREQIERCRLGVVQGKSLRQAFDKVEILPRMFKDLVMVGEETGNLSDQLKKIGDFYDQEIQHVIESFSSILEPVMIMVMGIVIGFIVVSLFLPIYQIVQQF